MKSMGRITVVVALVGLLAACLCLGSASTVAYAATPGATITTSSPSFCPVLADYIAKIQALNPGPVRDFVLGVAVRIYGKYCSG
jgi:hypothetical protein